MKQRSYPDVSDILERKAEGRRALAKLGFVEKVERIEALRERLAPLVRRRLATAPNKRGATKPSTGNLG
jgi:hypothetical protein